MKYGQVLVIKGNYILTQGISRVAIRNEKKEIISLHKCKRTAMMMLNKLIQK